MAKRSSNKIKQMAPQKLEERRVAARLRVVQDIGATIDLPEIQRRPDDVEIKIVEQLGNAARTTDRTLRKLTRVEKLRRAGVLEPHEADACEFYADVAAMAWDTTGCTANYEGMGGGNYVGATARAHDVNHRIASAREDYAFITAAMPRQYIELFEAVICQNSAIAAIAGERFSTLGRSQREQKTRAIVKLCANLVHGVVASRLPVDSVAVRLVEQVRTMPAETVIPERITDIIMVAIANKAEATVLHMSACVYAEVKREAAGAEPSFSIDNTHVHTDWAWAWMLQ